MLEVQMIKNEPKNEQSEIKEAIKVCKEELKDAKTEVKEVKQEVKTDKQMIEELTCLLQRERADYENFKKHVEKTKKFAEFFHKKEIVTNLLPVLDMFELALKYTNNQEEFVKGVKMIYVQFLSALENEGLSLITDNKNFNPELHEAVMTEESDKHEGAILEELQKGYMLDKRVIRHSRVKISKKNEKVH